MRLVAFRIQNYKTVVDSGRVEVRPDVTCLLGQNEAGKSAVLQAIWKSRNVANRKFDMLYDYPKHDYVRARGSDPVATVLEFQLGDDDVDAFRTEFGSEPPSHISLTTTYQGKTTLQPAVQVENDDLSKAKDLSELLAELPAEANAQGVDVVAPLRQQAQALLAAVTSADYGRVRQAAAALAAAAKAQALQLKLLDADAVASLNAATTARSGAERLADVNTFLIARIPAFIYFDEYGILKTRIYLPDFLKRSSTPDPEIRTQTALFEWAHVQPKELLDLGIVKQQNEAQGLVERRKEERRTLLESASFSLTGDWKEWWPQQREHKLHMSADGDDLVLQVSDDKNPWKVDFQERSRGFQWFFSFYLTFLVESGKAHQGAILLLDEPGLHLHVTAQQRLLSFFQRVSERNQLIYTSHSPFMVDPDHLDNVRTVYLRKDEKAGYMHTKVSPTTEPEGDHETCLPLQAALGYGVAQTLFIGKKTLIVEGITDYWILKTLSAELAKRKRSSLPEELVILFAGGTSRVLPLVSLFARPEETQRRLVVLLDADKAGLDKATKLKRELLQHDQGVALISDPDLLGPPGIEVEDVVSRGEFTAALQQHKGKFKATKAKATTNVQFIREVYQENGWGDLTHGEKALLVLALVDHWRTGKGPDDETLDNAEKVIAGLAKRFV
ncbi:MAG: AAA family ATPase [Deltaproteobacteria bacterium]|nr:AAA family ATPase [Deltaproteobacteria bacterium]